MCACGVADTCERLLNDHTRTTREWATRSASPSARAGSNSEQLSEPTCAPGHLLSRLIHSPSSRSLWTATVTSFCAHSLQRHVLQLDPGSRESGTALTKVFPRLVC